jgi:pyruvate dehydrogenase E1 component alpha subunit
MITAYRNHVQPIGTGHKKSNGKLYGKVTGTSKGWVVLCTFSPRFWRTWNCWSTNPVRAGMAFADQYFNTGGVTYFVERTARQGSLHEAFNMAMLEVTSSIYL